MFYGSVPFSDPRPAGKVQATRSSLLYPVRSAFQGCWWEMFGLSSRINLCSYPGRCNLLPGALTVKNFHSGGRSRKDQTRSWPADTAPGYNQPHASSLPHKPCLQEGIQQRTLQRDHEVLDLGPVTLLSIDTNVLRLNLLHPWKS